MVAAVLTLGGMAAGIAAQGNRVAQNEDVLPALLTEVRGLRAAMEQMASAGPRVQLALGRLQLQEQRLNTMIRRVEAIRDSLASARATLTANQNRVASLETELKTRSIPAEEREMMENHLIDLKRSLASPLAEVQRLTAEEGSLVNEIASEQGRWADFNQRLEELERALVRR
jgi:chromosome segregation ATPase